MTAALSAEAVLTFRKVCFLGGSTGEMAHGLSEGELGREAWCWDLYLSVLGGGRKPES